MLVLVACVVVMTVLLFVDLPFLGDWFSLERATSAASRVTEHDSDGRAVGGTGAASRVGARSLAGIVVSSCGWSPRARSTPATGCRSPGDFYDVQAHRMLDGRPVDAGVGRSARGLRARRHSYMYFGPAPAFLRHPDRGAAPIRSTAAPAWRRCARVRGGDDRRSGGSRGGCGGGRAVTLPSTRWTRCSPASTAFVVGAGTHGGVPRRRSRTCTTRRSSGASRSAFAAFDAILAWIERPRAWVLLAAGLLTLLALLSRLAVGIGPAAALGAARGRRSRWRGSGRGARRATARLGLDAAGLGWSTVGWLAAAVVVPLAVYAAFNAAKFGTLFSVPYDHQAANAVVPERKAILAANGGTLVNVQALPTNLWQYLRPDAFRLDGAWPWVRLPTWRPTVIGDLRYDMLDYTSSVTAAMPLLFVLAIGGVVTMIRAVACGRGRHVGLARRPGARCGVRGGAVAGVRVHHRALHGRLPAPARAARVRGAARVRRGGRDRRRAKRGTVVAVSIVLGVLALWSCVANVSIAREYQLGREQVTTFLESSR